MTGSVFVPEADYACDRGHVFKAPPGVGFSLSFSLGGDQFAKTGPLCPYCAANFLVKNCSAREVTVPRVPAPLHVVFEGADACGKTTQVRLLRDRFEAAGRPAVATSFPRYDTMVGHAISRHLRGKIYVVESDHCSPEIHEAAREDPLYLQAMHTFDRYAAVPGILYDLLQGHSVVSSRWWQSSVLYGADSDIERKVLEDAHALLPRAHLNVLLHLTEEESLRRRPDLRDFLERDRLKQARLREAYLAMWREEAARDPLGWVVVASDKLTEVEVCDSVWEAVMRLSSNK